MDDKEAHTHLGGPVDMETHAIDSQFVNLPIVEIFRNCVYTHTLRE